MSTCLLSQFQFLDPTLWLWLAVLLSSAWKNYDTKTHLLSVNCKILLLYYTAYNVISSFLLKIMVGLQKDAKTYTR